MRVAETNHRTGEELEFLPAALEVVETPPSPAGRAIMLTIVLFFSISVVWASIGEINIVAVARGKIIPSGRSKTIQSRANGSISEIHVSDGQQIAAGDLLITLDRTETQAERERLSHEHLGTLAAITRIEALLLELDVGTSSDSTVPRQTDLPFSPQTPADISQVETRLYHAQWRQHSTGNRRFQAEIKRKRAEQQVIDENISKQRAILPLISERVQAVKKLSGRQFIAKDEYLALEQERIERRQDLKALQHRRKETSAAITQAIEALANAQAQFRSRILQEQSERLTHLHGLTQELAGNRQHMEYQSIRAPVTGVVQQLAVNTIGGVVTTAQKLMIIVPESDSMEVEAFIENKDIGFINEGQAVELKVDAFPFTKYGTLTGRIRTVSKDAIAREDMDWAFATHVALEQTSFRMDGKVLPVVPGMSVQVEIKTGSRKLIEFLLSPVIRGLHDSARER